MSDPRETLARIRARADAATAGPWEVGDRYHCQAADKCDCRQRYGPLVDTYQHPAWGTMHVHRSDDPWWDEGVISREVGCPPSEVLNEVEPADAEFIAAARTTVPALVDALEAVLKLHVPERVSGELYGTYGDAEQCVECEQRWPCVTMEAITDALDTNH